MGEEYSLFHKIRVYERIYHHCQDHGCNGTIEQLMAIDPNSSYVYANDIIGGKFEFAEKMISKNGEISYLYAKYVIGGRFELGEEVIARVEGVNKSYQKFLMGR